MNFTKKLLLVLLIVFWSNWLVAQVSEGGTPPSFNQKIQQSQRIFQSNNKPMFTTPIDFDVVKLREEDEISNAAGNPPRVGYNIPVNIDINNNGEWINLPTGETIWQMSIKAPGAFATMLYYEEFYIPEGGKLFVYDADKTMVLGSFTSNTNKTGRKFATGLLPGDEIVLEYVAPKTNTTDKPRIKIEEVCYIYYKLGGSGIQYESYGESLPCEVNVNCSEGDAWQHQKRGVTYILVKLSSGTTNCSGSILNNTAEDNTPYLLTAQHCTGSTTTSLHDQWVFYFHYETPGCQNTLESPLLRAKSIVGAKILVSNPSVGEADGSLMLLNQAIPKDYNVFYNGWDIRNIPATSGVGIHHPSGDTKKISTFTETATNFTQSAPNGHWKVVWRLTANGSGMTEGGSSGSSLFNQDGLVVGSLTGGPNPKICGVDRAMYSAYGKLWYHFGNTKNHANDMKPYLDPNNTGVETLKGRYYEGHIFAKFALNKTEFSIGEDIVFENLSFGADNYRWQFPGANNQTSTDKNPAPIKYNTEGTYTATLTINQGSAYEKVYTLNYYVTAKKDICAATVNIGAGGNSSQFPLGMLSKQIISSSIYTKSELLNEGGTINELSWKDKNSVSTARRIAIYLKEVTESEQDENETLDNEMDGAQLVYTSATNRYNWVNDGATKFTLTNPFRYSGTKNLKVIVKVITDSSLVNSRSAECYYTEKAKSHKQWVSETIADLPIESLGEINNNRPDISIYISKECEVEPIQAKFGSTSKKIFFNENFDDAIFPPKGWSVIDNGSNAGIALWRRGLLGASVFNEVVANSTGGASAIISAYSNNTPNELRDIDAMLVSPNTVEIPSNAKISFYAGYRGKDLDLNQGSFLVSNTNGLSWTELWSTGNVADINLGLNWRKQTIDLSRYAGQRIKFAWKYKSHGGYYFMIDDIEVYQEDNEGKIQVLKGDIVSFTDKSRGAPVKWDWKFAGGFPSVSSDQNPNVRYNNVGDYKVELDIINGLNESANIAIPNFVAVTEKHPAPEYSSSEGDFTLFDSHGQFLPPYGGTVNFTNKSIGTSWNWVINGRAEATTENFSFDFALNVSYSIELNAISYAGSSVLSKYGYVVVGGKQSIWNMDDKDFGYMLYSYPATPGEYKYYSTGANPNATSFAERFVAAKSGWGGTIESVKIRLKKGTNNGKPVFVSICEEKDGLPDEENPVATVKLNVADIQANGHTTIALPAKTIVKGAFYVIVSNLQYSEEKDENVAIFSSVDNNSKNSARIKIADSWMTISESGIVKGSFSLNIVPEFRYADFTLSEDDVTIPAIPVVGKTITITSDASKWAVTTTDPWITISGTGTGSGNGSFMFYCTENKSYKRNGVITISADGSVYTVKVEQNAAATPIRPAPSNLAATVMGNNENFVELTWNNVALENGSLINNDEVQEEASEIAIKFHDDQYKSKINHSSAQAKFGVYWNDTRLAPYIGHKIVKVQLFALKDVQYKKLVIYKIKTSSSLPAGTSTYYDDPYEQDIDYVNTGLNKWATFTLNTPLTIKTGDKLLVGFMVPSSPIAFEPLDGTTPATPQTNYYTNSAGTFTEYANRNYLITTILEEPMQGLTYTVFRDGIQIADGIKELTYIDKGISASGLAPKLTPGYKYHVVANYSGISSTPSNDTYAIIKYPLTVTANNQTRYVGEANPIFTLTCSGFQGTDTESDLDITPLASTLANASSPAGTYDITVSGGKSDNYNFSYVTGKLTIKDKPAPTGLTTSVQYVSDNANVIFNWTAATDAVSYKVYRDGVKIDEVATNSYTDNNVSEGNHTYSLVAVYKAGEVESTMSHSINAFVKYLLTVTVNNATRYVGEANPTFTLIYSGFQAGNTVADLDTKPIASTTANASSAAGSYDIEASGGVSNIYRFNYVKGVLTVTKKPAIIVFDNLTNKIYGNVFQLVATHPGATISYTSSNTSIVSVDGLGEATAIGVGTVTLTASFAGNNEYETSSVSQTITIAPRAITVTAVAQTKIYGNTDPNLTYNITNGTLMPGDLPTGALSRAIGENVGTHVINQSDLSYGANYDITFVSNNLTITKRAITVTAVAQTKVYGNTDPNLTYNITNGTLVPGDLPTGVLSRAIGENVGTHVINQGDLSYGANYDVTFVPANLTIVKRKLAVVANAKSKTYGDVDPTFDYTTTGSLAYVDAISGALSRVAGESVENYAINQGTLTVTNESNYDFSYTPANLTISKRAISIVAQANTKTYGDNDPELLYHIVGAVSSDAISGSLSRAIGENVGKYAISQGTLVVGNALNYDVTFVPANLTIAKRKLAVVANAKSKTYGDVDPTFDYTTTGSLAYADAISGALSRVDGESVGNYAINQGTLTVTNESNYDFSYTPANLTISKRAISIVADAKVKTYGEVDPELTYNTVGSLENGDAITGNLNRVAGENVGTYKITQGTVSINNASNYDITYASANLVIGKRALGIIADAKVKIYGENDPELTYTSVGLATGDVISGSLNRVTGENVGSYVIGQGSLSVDNTNYTINYMPANLTIAKRTVTITAEDKSKVYNTPDPEFTYTLTAGTIITGDPINGALTRTPGNNVGNYAITQGTLSLGNNYNIVFNNGLLTIEKANQNINKEDKGTIVKYVGDDDFALLATPSSTLSLRYESEHPDIASVSSTGVVSVRKVGTTTITVHLDGNQNYHRAQSITYTIQVKATIASRVEIQPATLNMVVGKTSLLQVKFTPANANQAIESWTSNNAKVATVDANGLVKAIGYGTATITVKTVDGLESTCFVTVNTVGEGYTKPSEGFSPDGDGINDYFIIEHIEKYPDNELTIFDRTGGVHYKVKSYANNWDGVANIGRFKGQKLSAGTYYYVLKVKGQKDIKKFVVIRY